MQVMGATITAIMTHLFPPVTGLIHVAQLVEQWTMKSIGCGFDLWSSKMFFFASCGVLFPH